MSQTFDNVDEESGEDETKVERTEENGCAANVVNGAGYERMLAPFLLLQDPHLHHQCVGIMNQFQCCSLANGHNEMKCL